MNVISSDEKYWREELARQGRSLFDRRFTHGSTGNLSIKLDDGILVTPTNSCLGHLDPERIAKVDFDGHHCDGDPPSKETFLHLSVYQTRPDTSAVVHLHSTWSVAVSCLADINRDDVLPPITAYQIMRVGRCPLVPYFAPGDPALANAVSEQARTATAMLLANHGPVVADATLAKAVAAAEELEETAKLFLMLRGQTTRFLSEQAIEQLRKDQPRGKRQ